MNHNFKIKVPNNSKKWYVICIAIMVSLAATYVVLGNTGGTISKAIVSSESAANGAKIILLVDVEKPFPTKLTQDSWTVVQWQTKSGKWIDVEGWQGSFHYDAQSKSLFVEWWAGRDILGKGPFRWVIYADKSRKNWINTTAPFHLPSQSGAVSTIHANFASSSAQTSNNGGSSTNPTPTPNALTTDSNSGALVDPTPASLPITTTMNSNESFAQIETSEESNTNNSTGAGASSVAMEENSISTTENESENDSTNEIKVFYVSLDGDNSDGLTWETAWNEMDQISWESVSPGSIIFLDGGSGVSAPMTYRTQLNPSVSGTEEAPITISLSAEDGHDGQVVLFGGNLTPLPECGQLEWDSSQIENAGEAGIKFENGVSNIIVDGLKRGGITIHGWAQNGIVFDPDRIDNNQDENTKNITLQYMEIFNNGGFEQKNDGDVQNLYYPHHAGAGIKLSGIGHKFHYMEVHDNAADAIQSSFTDPANGVFTNIDDFTLTNSWLYNQRSHSGIDNSPEGEVCSLEDPEGCDELGAPHMSIDYLNYPEAFNNRKESFNWCTHNDGIQIFSSNDLNQMTIKQSIIGPNLMTALILGDRKTETTTAWVNDLTLEDVVITRFTHSALGMKNPPEQAGESWDINRVTIYGHFSNTNKGTLNLDSTAGEVEHSITNSTMVFGRTEFPNGNIEFSNNCESMLYSGSIGGIAEDPEFQNIIAEDVFENDLTVDFKDVFLDNYTPNNPACLTATSRTTSIDVLLSEFNSE